MTKKESRTAAETYLEVAQNYLEGTEDETRSLFQTLSQWEDTEVIRLDESLKAQFIQELFVVMGWDLGCLPDADVLPKDLIPPEDEILEDTGVPWGEGIPPDPDGFFRGFHFFAERCSRADLESLILVLFPHIPPWLYIPNRNLIEVSFFSLLDLWNYRKLTRLEILGRLERVCNEKVFTKVAYRYLNTQGDLEEQKNFFKTLGGIIKKWIGSMKGKPFPVYRRLLRALFYYGESKKELPFKKKFDSITSPDDIRQEILKRFHEIYRKLQEETPVNLSLRSWVSTGIEWWDKKIIEALKQDITHSTKNTLPFLEERLEDVPNIIRDEFNNFIRGKQIEQKVEGQRLDEFQREEKESTQNWVTDQLQRFGIQPQEQHVMVLERHQMEEAAAASVARRFREPMKLLRARHLYRDENYTEEEASETAGISERTFRDYLRQLEEFLKNQ